MIGPPTAPGERKVESTSRARPFRWLAALANVGVDPALPRHATKHIVLTNQYAIYCLPSSLAAQVASTAHTLLPIVRKWIALFPVAATIAQALNAYGLHAAASAWIVASCTTGFLIVGRLEPPETEHTW